MVRRRRAPTYRMVSADRVSLQTGWAALSTLSYKAVCSTKQGFSLSKSYGTTRVLFSGNATTQYYKPSEARVYRLVNRLVSLAWEYDAQRRRLF